MVNYDSDSSGAGEDYTETDVLLGFSSKEAGSETVSRLGGRPEWITSDKPPSAALAKCKVCKDLMVLLLQLNGELPGHSHERRLYVFACRKKACRRQEGSIRTLRGLRVHAGSNPPVVVEKIPVETKKAAKPAPPSTGLGESLFGVKPSSAAGSGPANPFANPFSTAGQPAAAARNPFSTSKPDTTAPSEAAAAKQKAETKTLPATFAEKLSLNNTQPPTGPPPPPEPWPADDAQPKPYPVSWISDAEFETLDPTPTLDVPANVAMEVDDPAGGSAAGGKEDKEVFESSMDFQFQKFADRVGQNPEQVIRYEHCGTPLLYSKGDKVGKALEAGKIPSCGNCGASRVFEVQLAPHAITELEREEDGLDGMDWGTVIVAVCSKDCQGRGVGEAEASYLEEWAGVQWEELTMRR